ncbi:MAG: hypothetical protein ACM3ZE_02220 [Myxococcales bacterium]
MESSADPFRRVPTSAIFRSRMPLTPVSLEPSERTAPKLAFWLVLGGVPTVLLNRAIIPALPGSRSGIEVVLERTLALGGISSQLLALTLALLLVRLVTASIGAASVGALERLFVLPIGSAVGFLLVAASAGTLDPELHLLLAAVCCVGLILCARPALKHASTRSGGILLVLIAAASVCYAAARLVAIRASVDAVARNYVVARWLATSGQFFDLLSLAWVVTWMVISWRVQGVLRVGIAVLITMLFALLAHAGQHQDATFIQVISARAFAALAREPGPFLPAAVFGLLDLLALTLSLGLLSLRTTHNAALLRGMALLLLGRCSLDVPALAGMTTAGALLLAWFAPTQCEEDTSDSKRKLPDHGDNLSAEHG